MGTISFEIRKDKLDTEGQAPIRLVYHVKGQRCRQNAKKKVYPANWDSGTGQAIYVKKGLLLDLDIKEINNHLQDLKRKIEKIETRFVANEKVYSCTDVIKELEAQDNPATRRDSSSKELFAFIEQYIADNRSTRVKGSLTVFKSLKRHLEGLEKKKNIKIAFDKIDYPFFQAFQNYLLSLTRKDKAGNVTRLLNNITIAKQLSTLKTFLNYAKKQGIEVSTKYQTFAIKRENDLEVIALTRAEFESIYNMDLSKKPAWDRVRDVFCFSCATGLRFSDLQQLRREHIKADVIDLKAIKTGNRTIIPFNPYSKAILAKYKNDPQPLPVITNQQSNLHLANICDWAGLNTPIEIVRRYGSERVVKVYPKHELVRFHAGRKTFATLSLENGMSAEYVMKIGGWKDYKSFKRYINLTNDSVKGAMEAAWGAKIIKPKLKAV